MLTYRTWIEISGITEPYQLMSFRCDLSRRIENVDGGSFTLQTDVLFDTVALLQKQLQFSIVYADAIETIATGFFSGYVVEATETRKADNKTKDVEVTFESSTEDYKDVVVDTWQYEKGTIVSGISDSNYIKNSDFESLDGTIGFKGGGAEYLKSLARYYGYNPYGSAGTNLSIIDSELVTVKKKNFCIPEAGGVKGTYEYFETPKFSKQSKTILLFPKLMTWWLPFYFEGDGYEDQSGSLLNDYTVFLQGSIDVGYDITAADVKGIYFDTFYQDFGSYIPGNVYTYTNVMSAEQWQEKVANNEVNWESLEAQHEDSFVIVGNRKITFIFRRKFENVPADEEWKSSAYIMERIPNITPSVITVHTELLFYGAVSVPVTVELEVGEAPFVTITNENSSDFPEDVDAMSVFQKNMEFEKDEIFRTDSTVLEYEFGLLKELALPNKNFSLTRFEKAIDKTSVSYSPKSGVNVTVFVSEITELSASRKRYKDKGRIALERKVSGVVKNNTPTFLKNLVCAEEKDGFYFFYSFMTAAAQAFTKMKVEDFNVGNGVVVINRDEPL